MELTDLERRVIDISYKKKLSHIGSCLIALPIVNAIYEMKQEEDIFINSAAHSSLALYVILEKHYGYNAEELFDLHGVHCNRDIEHKIYASGGSLGHGIGIGLGMALANKENVYVYSTDGETAEGSWWESLRIAADKQVKNLFIMIGCNGFGAYGEVDIDRLEWRIRSFIINGCPKVSVIRADLKKYPLYLQGQEGHYKVLTEEEYHAF